ncbi:MAG: alanine racemase, partial [Gemmataceae bacterium]
MNPQPGRCVSKLETPALLVDLHLLERNLAEMMSRCVRAGKQLRVHFKSLKCGGLAKFLADRGVHQFLCAKLNEVEILVEAGQKNVLLANQVVAPEKIRRLAKLARLAKIGVCVDAIEQVRLLGEVARSEQVYLEIYIEVDIGMDRCGVSPGEETLELAKQVSAESHLIL